MKDDLNNRFGAQEGRRIVESLSRGDKAYIERAAQLNPSAIRVQTFDLASVPTNPISVGFAFKCAYIVSASDAQTQILLRPFSDSENNDYVPMSLKDALNFDYPINKCFINWVAQAGKTMTVVFFTDAKFESGSSVNQTAGTPDGNAFNDFAAVAFNSVNATLLDNSIRNVITIYNNGPDECRVGGSGIDATVGSEKGLRIPANQERRYKNTGAVYIAVNGNCSIEYQTES